MRIGEFIHKLIYTIGVVITAIQKKVHDLFFKTVVPQNPAPPIDPSTVKPKPAPTSTSEKVEGHDAHVQVFNKQPAQTATQPILKLQPIPNPTVNKTTVHQPRTQVFDVPVHVPHPPANPADFGPVKPVDTAPAPVVEPEVPVEVALPKEAEAVADPVVVALPKEAEAVADPVEVAVPKEAEAVADPVEVALPKEDEAVVEQEAQRHPHSLQGRVSKIIYSDEAEPQSVNEKKSLDNEMLKSRPKFKGKRAPTRQPKVKKEEPKESQEVNFEEIDVSQKEDAIHKKTLSKPKSTSTPITNELSQVLAKKNKAKAESASSRGRSPTGRAESSSGRKKSPQRKDQSPSGRGKSPTRKPRS